MLTSALSYGELYVTFKSSEMPTLSVCGKAYRFP
jgi:hypothetical protein